MYEALEEIGKRTKKTDYKKCHLVLYSVFKLKCLKMTREKVYWVSLFQLFHGQFQEFSRDEYLYL